MEKNFWETTFFQIISLNFTPAYVGAGVSGYIVALFDLYLYSYAIFFLKKIWFFQFCFYLYPRINFLLTLKFKKMNVTNIAIGVVTCLFAAIVSQLLYDYLRNQVWKIRTYYELDQLNKKEKQIGNFCTILFLVLWFFSFTSLYLLTQNF